MMWRKLKHVYDATRIEFTPELAAAHCFVRLPSGFWVRTLGPPSQREGPFRIVHVRGRAYRMEAS